MKTLRTLGVDNRLRSSKGSSKLAREIANNLNRRQRLKTRSSISISTRMALLRVAMSTRLIEVSESQLKQGTEPKSNLNVPTISPTA